MLIPIGHEHMSARRWPIITFALIAINVVVFLLTYGPMEAERPKIAAVKTHILMLAAMHPELEVPAEVRDFVEKFHQQHPAEWAAQSRESRPIADEWDLKIRGLGNPDLLSRSALQEEMDSLVGEYASLRASSLTEKYAFVPAYPKPIAYLTANFLHGGWLHLIGNMWFLWLAGFVLEDVWGRATYTIFYLVAGAAAMQVHAWTNPGSIVPALGASGAVAALMGAFLVRFPMTKIKMLGWVFFRVFRFEAAAIWLLPLWLIVEVFYGFFFGEYSGVAHWAHVGGFVFGAVGAVALRFTGIERKLDQAIVAKVNESAPITYEAQQLMEEGQFNAAEIALRDALDANPGSVEALRMLQQVHWRKNEISQYQEATLELFRAHLKARDSAAAWQDYEEYVRSGGQDVPAAVWADVCRVAEEQQMFERAVSECEKLIAAHPDTRESLMAQLRAAKICLRQLVSPEKALQFYEAANASAVPHLDWEQTITAGIRDARAACTAVGVAPVGRA